MKNTRFLAASFCFLMALTTAPVAAQQTQAPPAIAAQQFLQALLDQNYPMCWGLLTQKSQDGFAEAVARAAHLPKADVAGMFTDGSSEVNKTFWTSVRAAIGESKLKYALAAPPLLGAQTDATADVTFSDGVPLHMFKEGGTWKLGYVETFFPKGIPNLPAEANAPTAAPAAEVDAPPNQAAHDFFKAVEDKNYAIAWSLLSKKSQDAVIDGTVKAQGLARAEVAAAFDQTDPRVVAGFWTAFHDSAGDVNLARLAHTPSGTLSQTGDRAKVAIGGAKLLMFREGGRWKVGYMETYFPNGLPTPPKK